MVFQEIIQTRFHEMVVILETAVTVDFNIFSFLYDMEIQIINSKEYHAMKTKKLLELAVIYPLQSK